MIHVRGDHQVPHSEAAMHQRVAGKRIARYESSEGGRWVRVFTADGSWAEGLPGEMLPHALRCACGAPAGVPHRCRAGGGGGP